MPMDSWGGLPVRATVNIAKMNIEALKMADIIRASATYLPLRDMSFNKVSINARSFRTLGQERQHLSHRRGLQSTEEWW